MNNPLAQRALLITIDGFDPSYLNFPHLPTLQRLRAEGATCLQSETTFPTLTTACMASLLTGTYPATHHVPASAFYDKATDRRIDAPRRLASPTIAEILRADGRTCAAVAHFLLENRGAGVYLPASANVAESVARIFDERSLTPTFIALYFGETDSAGHRFGPNSPAMRATVRDVDRQIGAVLTELEARGWLQHAVVAVTSDHGMSELPAAGNVTANVQAALDASGATWEYAAPGQTFQPETEVVWIRCVRVALVSLRRPLPPTKRERLLNALRETEGIETIVGPEELAQLRASPRVADYVLIPAMDKHFASQDRGGHGSFAEMRVPLIFWGAGVRQGLRVDGAKNVDVVPTLLHWLNVPIPAHVEGRTISEIMR